MQKHDYWRYSLPYLDTYHIFSEIPCWIILTCRIKTASEGSRINISKSTYGLLAHDYNSGYRGLINAKNKGMINMYFLEG